MRYPLLLLLLFPFFVFANEAEPGLIKGKVLTSDNKAAAFVSVVIKSTQKGVLTDENGEFTFHRLKPGTYTLQVSLTGYETAEQSVTVQAGQTATVAIQLRLSQNQLQEVSVVSSRSPYTTRNPSPTLRLNEPLIEVPQSVQVVTGKALSDQQITSMSDGLIRNVSGAMRLEHWGDLYTNIYMRGSRVSAFRNGMNAATSYWSPLTEDMSFVDHVEFVKGPAGFMMSVGDPAGVYNVVTKKPTGVTKGEMNVTMGSYDLYRASLDLDGKFDKDNKVQYRLNLMDQGKNSFRPYEFNDRYSVAPVISYQLDDKTVVTAEYNLQHVKMSDVGSYYVFSTKGYGVLPRNFTTADPGLDPTNVTDQMVSLNLQHKLNNDWKLTVQAAYLDYKALGSDLWPSYVGADSMIRTIYIWDAASNAKYGQVFITGQAQTGKVHHRVIAGLDGNSKYYIADWNQSHDLDTYADKFSLNNPSYGNPSNGYPVWDRSKPLAQRAGIYATIAQSYTGVYAQDELGFFENKFRVTLAARYSNVTNNEYNTISTAEKLTPRIGASYSVDKNTSVYALYDQSFVPQSGFRRDGGSIKPLTGNNMEIGIKRDWLGGKWSTTLDAYRILRNNENAADPSDPTGRFIVQLGQTQSQGIEFDLRGEILPGFTVTANYALTDSKITKADSSVASQATIGNKVPGYAKHTANGWLSYQAPTGVLKGFGISGGFTFLSDRSTWSWAGATGQMALPDYFKMDGGIFWEQDKVRITCNVFNLLDKYLYSGSAYGSYYYCKQNQAVTGV